MAAKKPKSKKPYVKVRLVPEDSKMKDHGFYYYAMKPGKGEKQNQKLKVRKYDPITRKHIWWVEKKLPPHSKCRSSQVHNWIIPKPLELQ